MCPSVETGHYVDIMNPGEGFANIGRRTAEFFHLGMNYIEKCLFGELWNSDGRSKMGTLHGECERLCRSQVDPNVMKTYDEDKRFIINYVNANIIEAAMTYFRYGPEGGISLTAYSTCFRSLEEQTQWVYEVFDSFIDQYIYPCWSGENKRR